jgi:excisionase family DNA binding protein
MEKLLLRPEEAGAVLGVGRSTIYAMLKAGALPAIRVGHTMRVSAQALHDWVKSQSKQQPGSTER